MSGCYSRSFTMPGRRGDERLHKLICFAATIHASHRLTWPRTDEHKVMRTYLIGGVRNFLAFTA